MMICVATLPQAVDSAQVFVRDLAVILGVAAVTTVAFQWLRQPVVLGYLIAGLIVGPHFTPALLASEDRLHEISGLGVILILFSIGLEFRVKRLVGLGLRPAFVALLEMGLMMWLGYTAARLLGWSPPESLFTGAIVSVSSTALIRTVFHEHAVEGRIQELVFGVLLYEDLVAFVLLAALTAWAAGGGVDAASIGIAAGRLALLLAVLIGVGLLVVPRAIRAVMRLRRRETLLVASIGLCFTLALVVERAGYSLALGAFLAGSLIAESGHGELVERLVQPVRDVFAAIFFVSVGTLIDPVLFRDHGLAVIALTAVVLVGKVVGVSVAAFLTGRDVQTSVRAGVSMAQIGEFSFLFAALALASGRAGTFLPAVAVGVSSLTAFTSPFLVRRASRLASWIDRKLPRALQTFVALYASWLEDLRTRAAADERWVAARRSARMVVLDAALCALVIIGGSLAYDVLTTHLQSATGAAPRAARAIVLTSIAALCALPAFGILWGARRLGFQLSEIVLSAVPAGRADPAAAPRRVLVTVIQLAIVLCVGVPLVAVTDPFVPGVPSFALLLLAVLLYLTFVFWRRAGDLQGHVRAAAQVVAEALDRARRSEPSVSMEDVQALLPGMGELTSLAIETGSPGAGRTLSELDLRGRTGATVVAITRGAERVVLPAGGERLLAGDRLGITGTHDACEAARNLLSQASATSEVPKGMGARGRPDG